MTTPEEAKDVIRRWNEEGWSAGNYDLAQEIIAPVMTVHGAGGQPMGMGPDSLSDLIRTWRTGFPDGAMTIDELIVDGDLVGICNTWRGTHTGDFYGIPATGNRVAVVSVGLDRVTDGQVSEGWGELDMIGMMQQLGVMPMVGPGAVAAGRDPQWGESSTYTGSTTTSPAENKQIAVAFLEAVAQGAPLGDTVNGEVFVDHDPGWGTADATGVLEIHATLRRAIPDLTVEIDHDTITAEGDRVVLHSLWRGTHSGDELFGMPAAGAAVLWTQSDMLRVADGKIVERWVSTDTMSLLQQIGAVPTPGG